MEWLHERVVSRFELWFNAWWDFMSKSIVFGHGLGFHHGLEFFVQKASKIGRRTTFLFNLLADSGLWGILFVVSLIKIIALRQIQWLEFAFEASVRIFDFFGSVFIQQLQRHYFGQRAFGSVGSSFLLC